MNRTKMETWEEIGKQYGRAKRASLTLFALAIIFFFPLIGAVASSISNPGSLVWLLASGLVSVVMGLCFVASIRYSHKQTGAEKKLRSNAKELKTEIDRLFTAAGNFGSEFQSSVKKVIDLLGEAGISLDGTPHLETLSRQSPDEALHTDYYDLAKREVPQAIDTYVDSLLI